MSWCIVYLASPKDRRIGCCDFSKKFDILKASLTITKQIFPTIDIFIFHEDFTDNEVKALPQVKEFITVNFSGYDDIYVKYVFPKGYMLMCRFFSGIMQSYSQLKNYTHYMRLDDDSYFMNPCINVNHINDGLTNDYTYRTLFHDLKNHQALFEFTLDHLKEHNYNSLFIQNSLCKIGFLDSNNKYTGLAPYNNFHMSSLELWRHPLISDYTTKLEKHNLILRNGWLDANIHAMIIFVLAPFTNLKIKHDGTFGYRHNKHVSVLNSTEMYWDDSLTFYPRLNI